MKGSRGALAAALSCAVSAAAAQFTPPTDGNPFSALIAHYKFSGDIAASDSESEFGARYASYGVLPERPPSADDGTEWRWASVTKQLIAVLVMQEVEAGHINLDQPLKRYIPRFLSPNADKITVRQLLRHQSGLPNPDDGYENGKVPAFYAADRRHRDPLTGFCAGKPKNAPGGNWDYNNCDYMVAGALLQAVTGKPWQTLVRNRIAKPLKLESLRAFPVKRWVRWGKIDGKREPAINIAAYDASGALLGSPGDLIAFDMALMKGKLLSPASLATMWDGVPELGFVALGQWVFSAPLAGCAGPVRIVERRGAIGGVEIRNFMLPDLKIAVAAFSDSAPFDFGEIWQGRGFSYELLSTAACKGIWK
jgi:D-alanyl-D-alanine carboxypeptidase